MTINHTSWAEYLQAAADERRQVQGIQSQVHDLSIEKDHGDFGPGFLVHRGPPGTRLRVFDRGAQSHWSGPFFRHRHVTWANYTDRLLVAQTQH